VVIRTTDGQEFEKQLDYPKGDPRNPLTDDEIAGKFSALAEGIASSEDVERMRAAVNRAEEYEDVRELMSELVVNNG
jgi:2-methylcitrate dehydratase